MYVPVHLLQPHLEGGTGNNLAKLDKSDSGLGLEGKTGLPVRASLLLHKLPDAGISAPQSSDGSLAAALVRVLKERGDHLDGLLKVLLDLGAGARMGDNIAHDLNGNLLLESLRGDANVLPILALLIIHDILVIVGLDLEALATGDDLLISAGDGTLSLRELEVDLLFLKLKAVEQALEDTGKEGREVLLVDLREAAPEDKRGLAESGAIEMEGLLAGLHERKDVGLEGLSTDGSGDATDGVANTAAKGKVVLSLLDGEVSPEGVHDVVEVGLELLAESLGNGTDSTGSSYLDLVVLVADQSADVSDKLASILLHELGIETIGHGVKSTANRTDNLNILLGLGGIVGGGHGSLEVLDKSSHNGLVVRGELRGDVIRKARQTDKGGVPDTNILVVEQGDDMGHDGLDLVGDEVGSTLDDGAESKDTGLSVASLGVGGELGEGVEKGNDNLARRKVAGKLIEQHESGAGGAHIILILIVVDLCENDHALDGELLANIAHALDLHAPVTDSLGEESKGLSADLILSLGVAAEVNHQLDKILKVLAEQRRLASQELLENVESLSNLLIIARLDDVLENVDHGGNEGLKGINSLGILLGIEHEEAGANGHHGVDANISALGVAESVVEDLEKLAEVLESRGVGLDQAEDDVGTDFTLVDIGVGSQVHGNVAEIVPLALLEVKAGDDSDKTGSGVAALGVLLLQSGLEKDLADLHLLGLGDLAPVLGDESGSLDGGQLPDTEVIVCRENFDEEEKALGVNIVVLLELSRDGLDSLGISWRGGVSFARSFFFLLFCVADEGNWKKMLTNLRLLEERGKRLLVHGASRKCEQKGYQKENSEKMNRTEKKKRKGKEKEDPVGHTAGGDSKGF